MKIPVNQRYYLTILKELRDPIYVPPIGESATFHLDKDYCESEHFYSFRIDRTQENVIRFTLIKNYEHDEYGFREIYNEVFYLDVFNDEQQSYYFYFLDNEVTLEELQYDLVIADFFELPDLFDEDAEDNILSFSEWFLALCGVMSCVRKYIP